MDKGVMAQPKGWKIGLRVCAMKCELWCVKAKTGNFVVIVNGGLDLVSSILYFQYTSLSRPFPLPTAGRELQVQRSVYCKIVKYAISHTNSFRFHVFPNPSVVCLSQSIHYRLQSNPIEVLDTWRKKKKRNHKI